MKPETRSKLLEINFKSACTAYGLEVLERISQGEDINEVRNQLLGFQQKQHQHLIKTLNEAKQQIKSSPSKASS